MSCRHRKFWILSGGRLLWCYECGAVRRMTPTQVGAIPRSQWCRPTGENGENPWEKFARDVKS